MSTATNSDRGQNDSARKREQVGVFQRMVAAMDLAKVLNRSNRRAEADDDFDQRLREAQAKRTLGDAIAPPQARPVGDDEMNVFFDSPITITGLPATMSGDVPPVAPAAAPVRDGNDLAKKLALAAALALGGSGIGAGVPWLLGAYGKQAVTNVTTTAADRQIGVEVVPGGAGQ